MIFFESSAVRWLVPRRFTLCFFVLPNVARWRTPARRNFTAPLFFTWKRFFAADFVFSLGISFSGVAVLRGPRAAADRRRCPDRWGPPARGRRAPARGQ